MKEKSRGNLPRLGAFPDLFNQIHMDNKKRVQRPPEYSLVKSRLEHVIKNERDTQYRLQKEQAADWWKVRTLEMTLHIVDWLGEDGYNAFVDMPIDNGLRLPHTEKKATELLRAAVDRCRELGINIEETINTTVDNAQRPVLQ